MINRKTRWWIVSILIIILAATIGISFFLLNSNIFLVNNTPEYSLMIFSPTENLYNVSSTVLQSQTTMTQWSLSYLFSLLEINVDHCVYIVTNESAYLKVDVSDFLDTYLEVSEHGFRTIAPNDVINPVLGIGVDFEASNADIVPTICKLMNWSGSYNFDGQPLLSPNSVLTKILIVLLDGMRYDLFNTLLMPNLTISLGNILWNGSALAGVPPMTPVGTALLLTGIFAPKNGITGRATHQIAENIQTIFQIAENQGLRTEIVEGPIQFIDLNADLETWTPDQNYDGSTDDEIYSIVNNSIVLNQSDLLFVHFHNPDDTGHSRGLSSNAYLSKLKELGDFIEFFWSILPPNSAIFIGSDHGMHENNENGSRKGVHNSVIFEDISVPICILEK